MRPAQYNQHDERTQRRCRKCDTAKSIAEFVYVTHSDSYTQACSDCINRRRRELRAGARKEKLGNWTPGEIEKLRVAIDARMNYAQAAAFVGRSVEACKHKRWGLSMPHFWRPRGRTDRWPDQKLETLRYLRCELRFPFSAVARQMGITKNAAIRAYHSYLKEPTS